MWAVMWAVIWAVVWAVMGGYGRFDDELHDCIHLHIHT